MYCRVCGGVVREQTEICPRCGCRPMNGNDFCPNCGIKTRPQQEMCVKCKTLLPSAVPQNVNRGAVKQQSNEAAQSSGKKVMRIVGIILMIVGFVFVLGVGRNILRLKDTIRWGWEWYKDDIFAIIMCAVLAVACFVVGAILRKKGKNK